MKWTSPPKASVICGGPEETDGVAADGTSLVGDDCGVGVLVHPLTSSKTQIDAYASTFRRATRAAYVADEYE
jgi:hypothetical protein